MFCEMIIVTKSADRKHFSTALNAFKAKSFRTEQNLRTRIGVARGLGFECTSVLLSVRSGTNFPLLFSGYF